MKTYIVTDWSNVFLENGNTNPDPGTIEMNEEQILDEYWDVWSGLMIKKYGEGHYLITPKICIEDWLVTNWAWEKTDD